LDNLKDHIGFSDKSKSETLQGSFQIKKLPNGLKNGQRIKHPLSLIYPIGKF
jgi:hypothetical protein